MVWIRGVRIQCVADTGRPGQLARELPRILRVEVKIERIERLIRGTRKSFRGGRGNTVDELRQSRIGHGWDSAFSEIVVVQKKNPGVRSEAEFVSAAAPGEVVIDEEPRGSPSLHPGVVQPPEGGEGCVRATPLKDNGKCCQRSLEIGWGEDARIPGESRIEVVDEVLGKNV